MWIDKNVNGRKNIIYLKPRKNCLLGCHHGSEFTKVHLKQRKKINLNVTNGLNNVNEQIVNDENNILH